MAKTKTAAPAETAAPAPAPAPAPATKPNDTTPITVLVENPPLRGSRKDRWELVTRSRTLGELRGALTPNGHNTAGTLRWLLKAGLIKVG